MILQPIIIATICGLIQPGFSIFLEAINKLTNREIFLRGQPSSLKPYQAAVYVNLGEKGKAFCGGSLITDKCILTAAHCLQGASSADIKIGLTDLKNPENSTVSAHSKNLIIHKDYNTTTTKQDIAIIVLDKPIPLSDNVNLVKLPRKSDAGKNFVREEGIVTGWGKSQYFNDNVSPILRESNVRINPMQVCKLPYGQLDPDDSQLCTSFLSDQSPCNGDSGGPLCLTKTGRQIGIVSYGSAITCRGGFPVVYTNVNSYMDWIKGYCNIVVDD